MTSPNFSIKCRVYKSRGQTKPFGSVRMAQFNENHSRTGWKWWNQHYRIGKFTVEQSWWLSYMQICLILNKLHWFMPWKTKCPLWGSNSRPSDYETDALTNCAKKATGQQCRQYWFEFLYFDQNYICFSCKPRVVLNQTKTALNPN